MKRVIIRHASDVMGVGYADDLTVKDGIFEYFRDEEGKFPAVLVVGQWGLIIHIATRKEFESYKEREKNMLDAVEVANKRDKEMVKTAKESLADYAAMSNPTNLPNTLA